MTKEELNKYLSDFYLEVKKEHGELYKSNTLDSVRYGLQRAVTLCPGKETWDIVRAAAFQEANISFKAAKAEKLKRMGKGDTEHYPAITNDDLVKLYSSVLLNQNTPVGLANKVQFDIRLFFCRRGACRKAHSRSPK